MVDERPTPEDEPNARARRRPSRDPDDDEDAVVLPRRGPRLTGDRLLNVAIGSIVSGITGVGVNAVSTKVDAVGVKVDAVSTEVRQLGTDVSTLKAEFAAFKSANFDQRVRDLERAAAESSATYRAQDERLRRLEDKK